MNKKRTNKIVDLAVLADYRVKIKENERQVLRPCQRNKKAREHDGDGDKNSNGCA